MDDVEVLRALVEEYSPSGDEQRAVRRFTDVATALGFDVRTDEVGKAIARIGRGSPRMVFLGHIDTVEGALPVRLEGGRLHGRGTCDAKCPLASALVAASRPSAPREILAVRAARGRSISASTSSYRRAYRQQRSSSSRTRSPSARPSRSSRNRERPKSPRVMKACVPCAPQSANSSAAPAPYVCSRRPVWTSRL